MAANDQSLILTDEQQYALADYYVDLDLTTVNRGLALQESGAVSNLKWNPHKEVVTAKVQGTRLYNIAIHLPADGVDYAECSCPMQMDCKHCVAVVFELIGNGGAGAVKAPSSATPAKVKGKDQKAGPPASLLGQWAEEKLGKTLSKSVITFLEHASNWWRNKKPSLSVNLLRQVSGQYNFGQWGAEVALFPAGMAPENEAQFLACLEAAMKTQNMTLPSPLSDLVDKGHLEVVRAEWQRRANIEKWQRNFGTWSRQMETDGETPVFRLRLHSGGAIVECRKPGEQEFRPAKKNYLSQFGGHNLESGTSVLDAGSLLVISAAQDPFGRAPMTEIPPESVRLSRALGQLVRVPALRDLHVVSEVGHPLKMIDAPLSWHLKEPRSDSGDYQLQIVDGEGQPVRRPVLVTAGSPRFYITPSVIYPLAVWPFKNLDETLPLKVPPEALETREGLSILDRLNVPPPARLAGRIRIIKPEVKVRCKVERPGSSGSEYLLLKATATCEKVEPSRWWNAEAWLLENSSQKQSQAGQDIAHIDRSVLSQTAEWLKRLPLRSQQWHDDWKWLEMRVTKEFPTEFYQWVKATPEGVLLELDPDLASLNDGAVAGVVRLDVQPAGEGMDWFDLKVDLAVADVTLTKEEIALLLKANGGWVRIAGKGWKKLEFQFSDEQQRELADLGLAGSDFGGEKQRLHALQLAGKGGTLLPAESAALVRRRVEEIQTRVAPPLPASITATLRPYQLSGFHFLAYLTANRFGGILADDMGLGKTLQTLAWIAWLRETQPKAGTALIVCPKSVQDNWRSEAAKFFPQLRVTVWSRSDAGEAGLADDCDLLVIHYQQLRLHEAALTAKTWSAAVLDEAQAIKNPTSQTTQAATRLRAGHRLALTGTPIENRLLDLWSILSFAMPGALGTRTHFTRHFDSKTDPLARRRLSARVRPFLLRRTKNEVAKDLPDRIEEDLMVEMEGVQQKLYTAELKRARAQLLKAKTSKELDKLRFHILTSLLRLRQICCHPKLVGNTDAKADSAKLSALMEQIEPIIEEGQKVLVFSQFTEMLDLIEQQVVGQEWPCFKLTGKTDDRGPLVQRFNEHEGPAVFLISLKAGGFGLNLTSASYVVLYDPWWNPAVEAQAIDRTHRIGQKQTVFAYRLLVKGSIEEKIRLLQKQKGALANDILGEESFAQALTLNDFQFLLGGDED